MSLQSLSQVTERLLHDALVSRHKALGDMTVRDQA